MATLIDATTDEAVNYVNDNLKRLGNVTSVIHRRNSNNIEYETIIDGEYKTLRIHSGFSSGYGGTGPRAFEKVLVELGFDKDEVSELVILNSENTFEFELKK